MQKTWFFLSVFRCLLVESQRLTRKIFFSLKCWFHVNRWPQRCLFHKNAWPQRYSEMFISWEHVNSEMLISLDKQKNVDFKRMRKLKDVDFTSETTKCWFHFKTLKCWLHENIWLQRCSFHLTNSKMLISREHIGSKMLTHFKN